MKFQLIFLMLFFLIAGKGVGQEINVIKANKHTIEKVENGKKITKLEGEVSLKAKNFEIFQADKVTIDELKDKVKVFGHSEFSFTGRIIFLGNIKNESSYLEYDIKKNTLTIK